jgi:hypothetical protein
MIVQVVQCVIGKVVWGDEGEVYLANKRSNLLQAKIYA